MGASTTGAVDGGTSTPGADGSGGVDAAPAPPPGTIEVDYGRWEGMFEVSAAEIVPDFGIATVTGELRYLGGADCPQVGVLEIRGRFYGESGRSVGKGLWESVWATGEGRGSRSASRSTSSSTER